MSIGFMVRTAIVGALGFGFVLSRLWAGGESRETVQSRGTLAGLDDAARRLVVKPGPSGETQTFEWNEATRFFDNDGPITPAALRPGQRIAVVVPKKGALVATRVEVEPVYSEQNPG